MKEVGTTSWNSLKTDATNTSLFTGLPGGGRSGIGYYYAIGNVGYWWSSTDNKSDSASYCYLGYDYGAASRNATYKKFGFSVRCLRD